MFACFGFMVYSTFSCSFLHFIERKKYLISIILCQIGPFILEWLPQIQAPAHIVDFLQLVINVVKFNATYLDEEIVHGIVKWVLNLTLSLFPIILYGPIG